MATNLIEVWDVSPTLDAAKEADAAGDHALALVLRARASDVLWDCYWRAGVEYSLDFYRLRPS